MPTPAFVRAVHYDGPGTATATPPPIAISSVVSGDTLLVSLTGAASNYAGKVQSITDSAGNKYQRVISSLVGNLEFSAVWAATNVIGGNLTITVTLSVALGTIELQVYEYGPSVVGGSQVSSGSGTVTSSGTLNSWGTQTLLAILPINGKPTVTNPGGYTQRLSAVAQNTTMVMCDLGNVAAGNQSASYTIGTSQNWATILISLAAAPALTNGTVVLGTNGGAGSIIGTAGGNGGTTNAAMFDANNWTYWQNPSASGDYVGIDCAAPAQVNNILLSWTYSQATFVTAGTSQLQASNDPTFASFTTLFTFSNATYPPGTAVAGILLNSISVPLAGYYRYYRLTLPAANTAPADLEFYGNYYSGVNATCAPVSITNFNGTVGGNYDTPVRIRMACATTGATIWYTTDGSTPSAGGGTSQQYTGPVTITSTSVVQAIAVLSGLSNSRVALASYHIGHLLPMDIAYAVNRGGYRIWSVAGDKMLDPVSGLWYWCGINEDSMGVYEYAQEGIDIYSSPDLRNWSWAGFVNNNSNPQQNRCSMVYNAANNNYVIWTQQSLSANMSCWTAPNPAGPWTQVGATITSMDGYSTKGDHKLFLDTDGTCYLIFDTNGGPLPDSNWYMSIHKLNAAYTASSGTFVAYVNSGSGGGTGQNTTPFGQQSEGPAMAKIGGTYYFMASNLSPWTPAVNLVCTGTSPTGPWSAPINPFQPDPTELTDGAAGYWGPGPLTPSQNYAYDSQTDGLIVIPGRQGIAPGTPALMYVGDRWDFRNFGVIQTYSDSFQGWRHILLPVQILPNGNLQLNWTNNWTFDAIFPQNTGQPTAPSGLVLSYNVSQNPVLTWTNNQTGSAYALYLDRCTDGYFGTNVVSEVLAPGTTTFTDTSTTQQTGLYYRIRAVNASGNSVTKTVPNPPVFANIAGTWQPGSLSYNNAGTWVPIQAVYANIGGTWTQVH